METGDCIEYAIFGKYSFDVEVFRKREDLCQKLFALPDLTDESFQEIIQEYEVECEYEKKMNSQELPHKIHSKSNYCGTSRHKWHEKNPISPFV